MRRASSCVIPGRVASSRLDAELRLIECDGDSVQPWKKPSPAATNSSKTHPAASPTFLAVHCISGFIRAVAWATVRRVFSPRSCESDTDPQPTNSKTVIKQITRCRRIIPIRCRRNCQALAWAHICTTCAVERHLAAQCPVRRSYSGREQGYSWQEVIAETTTCARGRLA